MIFEILPFPTPVNPDPIEPPGGDGCSCSDCSGCIGSVFATTQLEKNSAEAKKKK